MLDITKEGATRLKPIPRTDYYLEIVFVSLIVVYLVNYFFGKKINDSIATSWASASRSILESNFSRVGEVTVGGKDQEKVALIRENAWTYSLKSTGRINCIGMQTTLNLRKRHDLFSLFYEFLWPAYDTVTFSVLMAPDAMDPFIFAVVKKKEEKKFRKASKDVTEYSPSTYSNVPNLPASLCVLSEVEELPPALLFDEVLATLKAYENDFVRMHFSDQALVSSAYPKSLQFEFRLPVPRQMERLQTLTKMVMFFIDLVPKTRLSKAALAKCEKSQEQDSRSQAEGSHGRTTRGTAAEKD